MVELEEMATQVAMVVLQQTPIQVQSIEVAGKVGMGSKEIAAVVADKQAALLVMEPMDKMDKPGQDT